MFDSLIAYPIASTSALAFYAVMLALVFPATRARTLSAFSHPLPPTQHYLLGFDTLRGAAAAIVVLGHFWYFTYPVFSATQHSSLFWNYLLSFAYKAVPIFCALSGFLIYRSVLSITTSGGSLYKYAVRRFFRIYPVFAVGVLLSAVFRQFQSTSDFLAELSMLQIFGWPSLANLILWSVFAEVQFYALLPILFLLFSKRRMAALSILIIAALAYIDYPSRGFGIWKYFFFGILASEISEKLASFRLLNVVLFSTGAALLFIDFLGPEWDYVAKAGLPSGYSNQTLTLGVACTLILATLPHLSLMARALSIAPFKIMGVTSYSVFIIHPFFMMANFPVIGNLVAAASNPRQDLFAVYIPAPSWSLPFVFLPAVWFWGFVCFLLIERPGMRLGKRVLKPTEKRSIQASPAE
jgi:peptidoglycan/LPS O-acetylase OafA/YrhL